MMGVWDLVAVALWVLMMVGAVLEVRRAQRAAQQEREHAAFWQKRYYSLLKAAEEGV